MIAHALPQLKLRPSALPLAMTCPGSVRVVEGEVMIDDAGEPAQLGNAVHEGVADLVRGDIEHPDDIDHAALATKHSCEPDSIPYLVSTAWNLYHKIRERLPAELQDVPAQAEVKMVAQLAQGVMLPGTADVVIDGGRVVFIADWKSGWKDSDYSEQTAGYAESAWQNHPDAEVIITGIIWLREQSIEVQEWTRTRLAGWTAKIEDRVINWDGTYKPGTHCTRCRRFYSCPARTTITRASVQDFADEDIVDVVIKALPQLQPQKIIDLYNQAQMVAKQADQMTSAIKQHIRVSGAVVGSEGRQLAISTNDRRTILPLVAWPTLTQIFTAEEVAAAVKISLTTLQQIVKSKAPRGQKGVAAMELLDQLNQINAIETKRSERLNESRAVVAQDAK